MIALSEHTETTIVLMGQDEARRAIETIKTSLDSARRTVLDLYEREGWRALGYDSWRDCAQAEFGHSVAYLYRQLTAAKIERDLDSPIGEMPESHLREVAKSAPADRPRVIERATELAGSGPRTAKHIAEAAAELTQPDLPPEYDIIKRRYEKHGYTLASAWDGAVQRFVVRKDGGAGVVLLWPDVLTRLERLESDPPPPSSPVGWACEVCGVVTTDMRRPTPAICATCCIVRQSDRSMHLMKESRDAARLERARGSIARGNYITARAELDGIEVSTYARDQLLATIPSGRAITLEFTPHDCAALLKEARFFANSSNLTKNLPTIGQTLVLIVQAIKGAS